MLSVLAFMSCSFGSLIISSLKKHVNLKILHLLFTCYANCKSNPFEIAANCSCPRVSLRGHIPQVSAFLHRLCCWMYDMDGNCRGSAWCFQGNILPYSISTCIPLYQEEIMTVNNWNPVYTWSFLEYGTEDNWVCWVLHFCQILSKVT